MKPIMVLPPDLLSEADIKTLRDNDLCVVVAKDPSKVRFIDPIPAAQKRSKVGDAAIKLSRMLLTGRWGHYSNSSVIGRSEFAKIYVDLIMEGSELDPAGSPEEVEQSIYDSARADEIRRLAREDTKAERAKKKEAK